MHITITIQGNKKICFQKDNIVYIDNKTQRAYHRSKFDKNL